MKVCIRNRDFRFVRWKIRTTKAIQISKNKLCHFSPLVGLFGRVHEAELVVMFQSLGLGLVFKVDCSTIRVYTRTNVVGLNSIM